MLAAAAKVGLELAKRFGVAAAKQIGKQVPKLIGKTKVLHTQAAGALSKGISSTGAKLAANITQQGLKNLFQQGVKVAASPAVTKALVTEAAIDVAKHVTKHTLPSPVARYVHESLDTVDSFAGVPII